MTEVLDILAWNVYIGNRPETVVQHLEGILREKDPEVAVLMEATRVQGHLYGLGYHVIQMKPRPLKPGNQPGQANIAILVRKDLEIKKKRALRMKTFWIGPKHGWPQDPRVYRSVKVKKRNKTWKIGGAHTPFGVAARNESRIRLVAWLKRSLPGTPTVLVLDANMHLEEFRTTISGPAGAQAGGVGIDLIAVKNAKLFSAQNLGLNGSDHPAMLYKVIA